MHRITLHIFIFFLFTSQTANSQVDEAQLKAAYIYQLAQEIEWANQNIIDTFQVGLLSHDAKTIEHFSSICKKYKLKSKVIAASNITRYKQVNGYDLIFIDEEFSDDLRHIARQTKDEQTLLISYNSENKLFFHLNLVWLAEEKRISFEVNRANLEEQKFSYTPELLLYGGSLVDIKDLYAKTINRLKENRDTLKQLNLELLELNNQKKKSELAISSLIIDLNNMDDRIVSKENEYIRLLDQITEKDKELEESKSYIENQLKLKQELQLELNKQLTQIKASENRLEILNEQSTEKQRIINEKQEEINLKEKRIESQSDQISFQKQFIIVSILLLFVFIIVIGLIIHLLKYRKKVNTRLEQQVEEKTAALSMSQKYYKSLFENSPVSLIEFDIQEATKYFTEIITNKNNPDLSNLNQKEFKEIINRLQIRDINKRALAFYNLNSLDEFIDAKHRIFESTSLGFIKDSLLLLMNNEQSYSSELTLTNFQGEQFYTVLSWVLVTHDHKRQRLLLSIQDITQRRISELELEKHRDKLKVLVDDATSEVRALNKQLLQSNQSIKEKNENLMLKNSEISDTLEALKQTQRKLVDAEKMALLGMLTAGIAHEINNPMNYISAGSQALEMDYQIMVEFLEELKDLDNKPENLENLLKKLDEEEVFENLDELFKGIHLGVSRVTKIIEALNTYSYNKDDVYDSYSLNQAIENSWTILGSKHKNKVKLIYKTEVERTVECNAGKINQVFLNVLSNAIDAIPKEGQIEITSDKNIKTNTIHIFIKDNGVGVDAETLNKVFAPFFTTKVVGTGTGLGLYICKGIMDQHQGDIILKSKPQIGTTVEIILPIKRA